MNTQEKKKDFSSIKYKVCDLDRTIDEKGSAFIALRKMAWGIGENEDPELEGVPVKLDLRKYYTTGGGERMSKGVSFLTEDGPNELVHVLLEEGYGNTTTCMGILKGREDYKDAIKAIYALDPDANEEDSEFFDPRKLLEM